MQPAINCDSRDKPGKNEVVRFMPTRWARLKNWSDWDRKRISACREPASNRTKKS